MNMRLADGGCQRTDTRRPPAKFSRLVALSTAGMSALAALSIAVAPAAGADGAPKVLSFTASYSGTVTPPNGPPPVVLSGTGKASRLGNSTNKGYVAVTGPATSCPDTGFAVENDEILTSVQSGDQIMITVRDESCPIAPGRAVFHGSGAYVVTGGTGRFVGATGQGTFDGTGDFEQGLFSFTLNGTISAPSGA